MLLSPLPTALYFGLSLFGFMYGCERIEWATRRPSQSGMTSLGRLGAIESLIMRCCPQEYTHLSRPCPQTNRSSLVSFTLFGFISWTKKVLALAPTSNPISNTVPTIRNRYFLRIINEPLDCLKHESWGLFVEVTTTLCDTALVAYTKRPSGKGHKYHGAPITTVFLRASQGVEILRPHDSMMARALTLHSSMDPRRCAVQKLFTCDGFQVPTHSHSCRS